MRNAEYIRLRVEHQLGYKIAELGNCIELDEDFRHFGRAKETGETTY
jgi:hypothetical protein